jgi:hypothetical protein
MDRSPVQGELSQKQAAPPSQTVPMNRAPNQGDFGQLRQPPHLSRDNVYARENIRPAQQRNQDQRLTCWSCKQTGHKGHRCPHVICYRCRAVGHIATDCPNPDSRSIDCYLCKTQHEKGKCPQAGKLTSALAKCSVCVAYYKSTNMQLALTTHLFNRSGFLERDMCPIIVNITQPKRSGFLRAHNVCTI